MEHPLLFWSIVLWMIAWGVISGLVTPRVFPRKDMDISNAPLTGAFVGAATGPFGLTPLWVLAPRATNRCKQATGELSGGQQRMVEIGRTLMANAQVLLVDEPTAGLSKMLAEEVYQMLVDLRDRDGLTILLVDQEIRQALKIADYVYVLELGRNKYEGPSTEFTDLEKAFWVGS